MKKGCLIAVIVTTVLVVIIGISLYSFVKSTYNGFVVAEENVNQKWAQVENVYQRRADLIPNLVEMVKGYAKHEQETLNQVIEARNVALKAEGVKAQTQAENQLNSALANIFALSEAYPDLKANTNFLQLQQQLDW